MANDLQNKPSNHSLGIGQFATVQLRGMPIHAVSKKQTTKHLVNCARQKIGGWVVTPNLDILRPVSYTHLTLPTILRV